QFCDDFRSLVGGRIEGEGGDFLRCRQAADDVQADAAEETLIVNACRGLFSGIGVRNFFAEQAVGLGGCPLRTFRDEWTTCRCRSYEGRPGEPITQASDSHWATS